MLQSRSRRGGFTLLELLVVVAIIGLLASLLAVFVGGLTKKAKVEKTRATIERLSTAAQQYKERFLMYPPSTTPMANGPQNLHWYLCGPQFAKTNIDPNNPANFQWVQVGPFLVTLGNNEVSTGVAYPSSWGMATAPNIGLSSQAGMVEDAWGVNLGYYCAQQGNIYGGINHYSGSHPDWMNDQTSFDLWSRGPDITQPNPPTSGPPGIMVGLNQEVTNWIPSR